jgi:hypothetical protein
VSEQTWRPLGIDSDEAIAEYDALHDGVPEWMKSFYWAWIRAAITEKKSTYSSITSGKVWIKMLDTDLTENMCLALKVRLPNLRTTDLRASTGREQLDKAEAVLRAHRSPLQVADYLLAHGTHEEPGVLQDLLDRSKSAWTIGKRAGRAGLVRRVPLGVQVAADDVMTRAGRAGIRLAKAWEELYGLSPDPSAAYSLAIKAVEDATVPLVTPADGLATLGKVIKVIEDQGDWNLPMAKAHTKAPPTDVLVGIMRMLWHGQHDRHGGQPSAPGNVSAEEASVAVGLAVTLVSWFDAGLVARATP